MMDQTLQAKCDTLLNGLFARLATAQRAYGDASPAGSKSEIGPDGKPLPTRRRRVYWQGLTTPAVIPADGAETKPDLTLRPTGQAETWAAMALALALPATVPCALRVDVYDGPSGVGWLLTGTVRSGGVAYSRTLHQGPEVWRERQGWMAMDSAA